MNKNLINDFVGGANQVNWLATVDRKPNCTEDLHRKLQQTVPVPTNLPFKRKGRPKKLFSAMLKEPPSKLTAAQLSRLDDLATSLVVDPVFGVTTLKMELGFKEPLPQETEKLRKLMEEFIRDQDYQLAFNQFVAGGWLADFGGEDRKRVKVQVNIVK